MLLVCRAWNGRTWSVGDRVCRWCEAHLAKECGRIESIVSAGIVCIRLDSGVLVAEFTDRLDPARATTEEGN